MGSHYKNKFILRVTEVQPYIKLTWKTDEPVWVNQWPLKAERLHKLHGLAQEQLWKAVYVLNFLNRYTDQSAVNKHSSCPAGREQPQVCYKNLEMGQWSEPGDLITWGKGYACVSTDNEPRWIPAGLI